MTCFFCKRSFRFYQPLDANRKRFMRKVYKNFEDSSYLCLKCFEKFETVYRKKKKLKSNSSDVSIRSNTLSVITAASKTPSDSSTHQSKENAKPNQPDVEYFSHSLTSVSNTSIDSTDRLVGMTTENPSLNESARVTPNAEVGVAAAGAQRAVMSVLRRKRIREEENSPEQTPAGRRRTVPHVVGYDDESDDASISSRELDFVRPIVKRRKEPVVHLNQDVMDIYLANTSGG